MNQTDRRGSRDTLRVLTMVVQMNRNWNVAHLNIEHLSESAVGQIVKWLNTRTNASEMAERIQQEHSKCENEVLSNDYHVKLDQTVASPYLFHSKYTGQWVFGQSLEPSITKQLPKDEWFEWNNYIIKVNACGLRIKRYEYKDYSILKNNVQSYDHMQIFRLAFEKKHRNYFSYVPLQLQYNIPVILKDNQLVCLPTLNLNLIPREFDYKIKRL